MPVALHGVVLAAISACGFATLSVFIRMAFNAGATMTTILSARFLLGAALLWLVVFVTGKLSLLRKRDLFPLILLGTLGYGLMSACFAQAVHHLTASLASLLLYLYPSIVTCISFWRGLLPYSYTKIGALLLSLLGLLLTIGIQGDFSLVGVGFGLAAAVSYSVYLLFSDKVLRTVDPLIGTTVICTSAGVSYLLVGLLDGSLQSFLPLQAWLPLIGMAFFSTFMAMLCLFAAIRSIGAARTSIISTLEPLVTVLLSVFFLSETLLPLQWAGGALIMGGILLLEKPPKESAT